MVNLFHIKFTIILINQSLNDQNLLIQDLDRLVTGFFLVSAFLAGFTIFLERSSLAGGFRLSGVFVYFFEGSFFYVIFYAVFAVEVFYFFIGQAYLVFDLVSTIVVFVTSITISASTFSSYSNHCTEHVLSFPFFSCFG